MCSPLASSPCSYLNFVAHLAAVISGLALGLPIDIDYLTNGGALIREALAADAEAERKLADALQIFDEFEKKTKEFILKSAQA